MEIDNPIESNGSTAGVKENGLRLYPVSATDSGEGLPYAPEDWPNPGDVWSWKVGKRVAHSGCFLDRYLYLPKRLQEPMRKRGGFASKLSVEHFVRASFPGADVDAFFASFSWKIPAKKLLVNKGSEEELNAVITLLPEEISEQLGSDSLFGAVGCKAGNKICNSLVETRDSALEPMACDICCSEPSFCRDCCCILCCKTINSSYGGYSFIKCEAMVAYNIICGHVAHIDCALRSYMAGTVGGSIGLDAEYYCRRCDMRTDLVPHVTKIFRTCESIDSRDDIEKILNVGSCVLRGSQKTSAKSLLLRIEMAMAKLKSGTYLENIWKTEDVSAVMAGGLSDRGHNALEVTNRRESLEFGIGSPQILSANFDPRIESLKLKDEIDQVLHSLRKAQESEYKIAEERLFAQKNYILNLYQQLDKERFKYSTHSSSNDPDALLEATRNREDRIKWEIIKLREMEEVGKGFGKTSKNILKEHFGLQTEH